MARTGGSCSSARSRRPALARTRSSASTCTTPEVFDIVKTLQPSGRGELEITDVNNAYIDRGEMEYDVIDGFWGDAGESIEVYYRVID